MKLAYVVPRYGEEVTGGAEGAVRSLAERLAARPGWEVEVFTTCATDSRTWADDYPEGTVEVGGVAVHRFRSASGRHPRFDELSATLLRDPRRVASAEQWRWVEQQGPNNPAVVDAVRGSDADLVAFSPYLYHPIVHGVRAVADRAVLHPAAHDEPPLRLPIYGPVFRSVRGLVFYTETEREVTQRRFATAATPQLLLGLGVEPQPADPALAREALGVGDRPFLLCVGRIDPSKGTDLLARFFATYKERRPGPLCLVFAGSVVERPPAHPDIVVAGPVPEEVKWGAMAASTALVSPSAYESFSLVVVEAWTAGVPVLVNARCGATRGHCVRSEGGLWFDGYAQFEAMVDRLVADAPLRAALAERGRRYVHEHFEWPTLLRRYTDFLEALSA